MSVDIKLVKKSQDELCESTKFGVYSLAQLFYFHIKFSENNEEIDLMTIINKINEQVDEIVNQVKYHKKLKPTDQLRLAFKNTSLQTDVYVPFIELRYFKADLLTNQLLSVNQSKREVLMNEAFEIEITSVNFPATGGKRKRNYSIDFNEWSKNSTKVICVEGDGYCLLRAFIVSKANADKFAGIITKGEYRQIREDTYEIQTNLVKNLISDLNLDNSSLQNYNYVLPILQKKYEKDYQIIAVTYPYKILYQGKSEAKQIYILIKDNHADSLTSMTALLECSYFCQKCMKGHNNYKKHVCNEYCKYCEVFPNCPFVEKLKCSKCLLTFVSKTCLENHIFISKVCDKKQLCVKCKKVYLNGVHKCGQKICKHCKEWVPVVNHLCFIKPLNINSLIKQDSIPKVFLFFDFECMIRVEKNGTLLHQPNLCITQVVCQYCWNTEMSDKINDYCVFCKGEKKIFKGSQTVHEFLDYLFVTYQKHLKEKQKSYKFDDLIKIIAIAHNSRSYDCIFILKYVLENKSKTPSMLKKGNKILAMTINNIKFIDSLSFIPMQLKKFSSTFGLGDLGEKGEFPHGFNSIANWDYIGKLPDLKYYYPDQRSVEEREELFKWHQSQSHIEFNFQKEIIRYCEQDVKILMKGVMIFRDNWIKTTKLDPFTRCITLPMAVMESFDANYLKNNQIAIIPRIGYEAHRKVSYIGQAWLDFLEKTRNTIIKREFRLGRYTADGFIEKTKEAFEFYGCFFHGCVQCYTSKRKFIVNTVTNQNMEFLYNKTLEKEKYYLEENIKLTKIWECELKEQINSSLEMKEFFKEHVRLIKNRKYFPPIEPRKALYGGRVNSAKLFHEVKENEKILYYDFTSLYPFCCKSKHYPIGHPEIIRNPQTISIESVEGLIFCKILPPKNLYFAVLPIHVNDQILYTLCYQCAKDKEEKRCQHTTEERCLISTWVSVELKLAIEKGYQILEIYEIWNFTEISGGDQNENIGIFTRFINDCLKVKVESSDFPQKDMTLEEKQLYIENYRRNENIDLDINSITFNPGKRAVSKLMANSFWGE